MGIWIDRRRRLRLARFAKGLCPRCGEGLLVFPESSCKVCRQDLHSAGGWPSGASWSGRPGASILKGGNMLSNRLMRERATIIRNVGQRNDFGEWVAGQPVEVEVRCTSQPDTGRDRVLDPEGARTTARRFFWFTAQADVRLAGQGQTTDLLRYRGEVFRVIEIARWDSHLRGAGRSDRPAGR